MLRVIVGDIVEIFFDHAGLRFIAEITKITERLGYHNGGRDKTNPLVHFNLIEVLENEHPAGSEYTHEINTFTCDMSFVEKVIVRSTTKKPDERPFKGCSNAFRCLMSSSKNLVAGTKDSLLIAGWVSLYGNSNSVDMKKLENLSKKSLTFTEVYKNIIYSVKKQKLLNWIKRNKNRLLIKKKDLENEITRFNTDVENDYYADLDAQAYDEIDSVPYTNISKYDEWTTATNCASYLDPNWPD